MKISSKSRGFTLIELLVVVTIMIILTGVIINSLSGSRAKARDAQRVSDLGQLQLALAMFVDRCGSYPAGISAGTPLTTALTAPNCPTNTSTGTAYKLGDFISQIPTPPSGAGQTYYEWSFYYTVNRFNLVSGVVSGASVNYVLVAALETNSSAMPKSLQYSSIFPASSDTKWWNAANVPPFTYCGAKNGNYYYYCLSSY